MPIPLAPIPLRQDYPTVWPGVLAVAELHYSMSWGLTPGLAILKTYPQPPSVQIGSFGNLVIADSNHGVILYNCRVSRITGELGPDGQTTTVEIQDRRWAWQGLGSVSVDANAMDMRSKLVPWSIYSPQELAEQCLQLMGEVSYDVSALPTGLIHSAGVNLDNYLQAGENFAQSLANPHYTWDHTPPMEALARLCDAFGCVVTLNHSSNNVIICKQGVGTKPLPSGTPYESIAIGVSNPRIPVSVNVAGAPVRIQMRFALEPVGEEYDGKIIPINQLSYTPIIGNGAAQPQISTVTYTGTGVPLFLGVYVTIDLGTQAEETFTISTTGGSAAIRIGSIANQIANNPAISAILTPSIGGGGLVLTLTAVNPNVQFAVEVQQFIPPPNSWVAATTQAAAPAGGRSWAYEKIPTFRNVRATPRLSYVEAVEKAAKCIWKMFRIQFLNVTTGKPPIFCPWYNGKIVRRQQFVLQKTRVEQVVPQARIAGGNNNNFIKPALPGAFGILADFYDGYSRDRPAVVYGSVYQNVMAGNVLYAPQGPNAPTGKWNTGENQRVYVDFDVDPYQQTITFSDYVYKIVGPGQAGFVCAPPLLLETACLVKDADFGNLIRWEDTLLLPGGTAPPQWEIHEDVAVGVIAQYSGSPGSPGRGIAPGPQNVYAGFEFAPGDIDDATNRANYYLQGMANAIQAPQTDHRVYIGIIPIDLDGQIQQVSYSVGSRGPTTEASLGTEYSTAKPPYPAPRRTENLPPNASAVDENRRERDNARLPQIDPNFGIKAVK